MSTTSGLLLHTFHGMGQAPRLTGPHAGGFREYRQSVAKSLASTGSDRPEAARRAPPLRREAPCRRAGRELCRSLADAASKRDVHPVGTGRASRLNGMRIALYTEGVPHRQRPGPSAKRRGRAHTESAFPTSESISRKGGKKRRLSSRQPIFTLTLNLIP